MPTKLIPPDELKYSFYQQVVRLPYLDHKRLVAKSTNVRGNDSYASSDDLTIFVPSSWQDEYDLVLSLGTDGHHHMLIDWDNEARHMDEQPLSWPANVLVSEMIAVRSTTNWHAWSHKTVGFDKIMRVHRELGNEAYAAMNVYRGYCGLRPPWLTKHGEVTDFPENYFVNPVHQVPPDVQPKVLGWDDLWEGEA